MSMRSEAVLRVEGLTIGYDSVTAIKDAMFRSEEHTSELQSRTTIS